MRFGMKPETPRPRFPVINDLRGVDLADVHPAPRRRRPRWDAPVYDPTPLVFVATVVAILLGIGGWFGALELIEWAERWGG